MDLRLGLTAAVLLLLGIIPHRILSLPHPADVEGFLKNAGQSVQGGLSYTWDKTKSTATNATDMVRSGVNKGADLVKTMTESGNKETKKGARQSKLLKVEVRSLNVDKEMKKPLKRRRRDIPPGMVAEMNKRQQESDTRDPRNMNMTASSPITDESSSMIPQGRRKTRQVTTPASPRSGTSSSPVGTYERKTKRDVDEKMSATTILPNNADEPPKTPTPYKGRVKRETMASNLTNPDEEQSPRDSSSQRRAKRESVTTEIPDLEDGPNPDAPPPKPSKKFKRDVDMGAMVTTAATPGVDGPPPPPSRDGNNKRPKRESDMMDFTTAEPNPDAPPPPPQRKMKRDVVIGIMATSTSSPDLDVPPPPNGFRKNNKSKRELYPMTPSTPVADPMDPPMPTGSPKRRAQRDILLTTTTTLSPDGADVSSTPFPNKKPKRHSVSEVYCTGHDGVNEDPWKRDRRGSSTPRDDSGRSMIDEEVPMVPSTDVVSQRNVNVQLPIRAPGSINPEDITMTITPSGDTQPMTNHNNMARNGNNSTDQVKPGRCRPLHDGLQCIPMGKDAKQCKTDFGCEGTKKCCFYSCSPDSEVGVCEHPLFS